jgi:hypothetical protein
MEVQIAIERLAIERPLGSSTIKSALGLLVDQAETGAIACGRVEH